MALMAVDKVVNDDKLLELFEINKKLWPAIRYSWEQKQYDFQGRFDFAFDGKGPPKMLEYNGDTPSMIIESSALQEDWFKDVGKSTSQGSVHQSNYINEALRKFMTKVSQDCSKPAFIFNG